MTCENILFADTPAMTKVLAIIARCKARNSTISFAEIEDETGVSQAHLKRLKNEIAKMNLVEFHKVPGKSTLWKPL